MSVNTYSLVLLAHVTAATILVGNTMFAPLVRRSLVAASSVDSLRMWLDFGRRSAAANPPAALVVLGTGLYLGSMGWWLQPWFFVAVGAWLANSLLASLVVKRLARATAVAAAGAAGNVITPELDATRRSPAWDVAHDIMRANDLAMLYVMFNKPSLAESCGLLGGAILLSAVMGAVSRRGRQGQRAGAPELLEAPSP